MRKIIIILFIILNISPSNASYAENGIYRVAGDRQFPPYEYIDSEGVYKGFNVDMLKAISLVTGMEFEFLPMRWEDAYNSIERGQADIIQGMKESDARRDKFLFSNSLLLNSQSIFVLDNNVNIKTERDLEGKTISLQKEDIIYTDISKIKDVKIMEYVSLDEALDALLDGKVDALVGNTLTVNYLSKEKNAIELLSIVGDSLNEQKYSIAVGKDNEDLLHKLNAGISEIQRSGIYDSLYRKWFGTPIKSTKVQYELLFKFTIGVSTALLVLIFMIQSFNKKLKKLVQEITEEQKALVYELRHYDKLQFMDRIISSIAHEIRNPLTSIKIYTSQMKNKLDDKNFILAASEDIPQEIDRIDELIKEFMEYTSPRKPIKENINLHDELTKTIKLVKLHISSVKLNIKVDKSYNIMCDIAHFKQIVLNILLNSIDAVKGKDYPVIGIVAREEDKFVSLSFNDNGYGMNRDDIQYIFEPFYTTKDYGNGVGMFVVKQLVDENDGTITVQSDGEQSGMSIILKMRKGELNEKQTVDSR